jgi:hypothetical protein
MGQSEPNLPNHKVGALVEAQGRHPVLELLSVGSNLLAGRGGAVVAADLETTAEIGLLVLAPVRLTLPRLACSRCWNTSS